MLTEIYCRFTIIDYTTYSFLSLKCVNIFLADPVYCTRKDILGRRHSLMHCFLFIVYDQHFYTVKNMCVYAQSDCVETVYELPLLLNNTASETFLHKLGAVLSVRWMSLGRRPGGDWANT